MFAGGSVLGLAIGGTIVQFFGWRLTFFSIIPIAICLIIIILRFIPTEKKQIETSKLKAERSVTKIRYTRLRIVGSKHYLFPLIHHVS